MIFPESRLHVASLVEAISMIEIGKLNVDVWETLCSIFYFPLFNFFFFLESPVGINFSSWLVSAVLIERFAGISTLHYAVKAQHPGYSLIHKASIW
jgi:hypothetical protein